MKKPIISLIAAIGENRELGKDNKLLWHLPEDLKYFNQKTKGHVVIMGYNTFRSLGKPLHDRINIVLSDDPKSKISGCIVAGSLEDALQISNQKEKIEIFVVGGAMVYAGTLAMADRLYLTLVNGKYDADVYFPDFSDFKMIKESQEYSSRGHKFKFTEWVPKK